MKRTFIFVLCPPYQGSTIITALIGSSSNVSSFMHCNTPTGESQWFFREIDNNYIKNRWHPDYKINMNLVHEVFKNYLDDNKQIWLEKSPPIICRAKKYEDYFSKFGDVHFIISIRNPYATNCSAEQWIEHAKYQKWNI